MSAETDRARLREAVEFLDALELKREHGYQDGVRDDDCAAAAYDVIAVARQIVREAVTPAETLKDNDTDEVAMLKVALREIRAQQREDFNRAQKAEHAFGVAKAGIHALDNLVDAVCLRLKDELPADDTDPHKRQGVLDIHQFQQRASRLRHMALSASAPSGQAKTFEIDRRLDEALEAAALPPAEEPQP